MDSHNHRRSPGNRVSRFTGLWPPYALLLATIVVACSPLGTLNELSEGNHYTVENGLRYGAEPRQVLDVYEPLERPDNTPVVVFFYGGGWREGDKADYAFVGTSLTEAGFTVVIPDYRLYPEVQFPAFVEDGADAVAWVERELIADTNRSLILMGHSAGAHIAGLLALDPAYLQNAGVDPGRLAGWIGLSGPYDFLPIESGYLLDVFPEPGRAASQPIRFASADAPPTLLVHGADDGLVEPGNSRRLASALEAAGVDVTLVEQDGRSHAATVAALAPPLEFVGDTRAVTVRFLRRVSGH